MKCKSTILFSLVFLVPFNLSALKVENPAAIKTDVKGSTKPQMPPGMTEDEMKMFSEFIESLDQETIDALTAIGEEIIKEADELGIDPFEYIELQAQVQKEFEDKEKKGDKAPKEKERIEKQAAQVIAPTADAQTAQEAFNGIVKVIPIIIQKAASDITLANEMLPFKYRLDDLVFYFTKLSDDKMLKYIGDPSFAPLVENAKKLYKDLVTLNDQFFVAEFSLEGENPYETLDVSRAASQQEIINAYDKISKIVDPDMLELQLIREGKTDQQIKDEVDKARKRFQNINDSYVTLRSKEESKFILDRILDAVAQAVDTNKVLDEAKKVVQKYEPDAVKLKQEQEKKETDARKKQDEYLKKRPITSRAFNMPLPSGKYKRSSSGAGAGKYGKGGGGYSPSGIKKKESTSGSKLPKTPKSEKKSGGSKGKDKVDKDKDKDKDKKEKKKIEGKKGEPTKGKEREKGKESSKDVLIALGSIEKSFSDLKDFLNENEIVKGTWKYKENEEEKTLAPKGATEGQGIAYFLTTAFPNDVEAKEKLKTAFSQLKVELTRKFNNISKDIKKTLDKTLKDKKEDQKQFKDEVAKLFKKFEESDEYISIALLMKHLQKETPYIRMGTNNIAINDEKKNFVLNELEKDVEKPEALIKILHDSYSKARDAVVPKEEKGKSGQMPKPPKA